MEKQDNTGLGLIGATIERVRNEKSLFGSALKKLVNSTEEELDNFLKKKIENRVKVGISRLISDGHILSIKALDGKRLIYNSKKTFKSYIDSNFVNWNLNKSGVATAETPVQVQEIFQDGTFMDIFVALPGTWNQKWVSQNQIIEFCETLPDWLRQGGYATMFLVKKDENKPVDEADPQDNLVVVYVFVHSDGLNVYVHRLENDYVCYGESRHRVVSPQLLEV